MPILSSAKKALRQSKRRSLVNRRIKTRTKTSIDAFKDKPSSDNLQAVFSAVDRAAKKNIFHKNKAARLKSRLSKLLKK